MSPRRHTSSCKAKLTGNKTKDGSYTYTQNKAKHTHTRWMFETRKTRKAMQKRLMKRNQNQKFHLHRNRLQSWRCLILWHKRMKIFCFMTVMKMYIRTIRTIASLCLLRKQRWTFWRLVTQFSSMDHSRTPRSYSNNFTQFWVQSYSNLISSNVLFEFHLILLWFHNSKVVVNIGVYHLSLWCVPKRRRARTKSYSKSWSKSRDWTQRKLLWTLMWKTAYS